MLNYMLKQRKVNLLVNLVFFASIDLQIVIKASGYLSIPLLSLSIILAVLQFILLIGSFTQIFRKAHLYESIAVQK